MKIEKTSVYDLPLGEKVSDRLHARGIRTAHDLLSSDPLELKREIDGFGSKKMHKVSQWYVDRLSEVYDQ